MNEPKAAPPIDPEPTYPCEGCGVMRTKDEGGTVFTVCDVCWATQPIDIKEDRERLIVAFHALEADRDALRAEVERLRDMIAEGHDVKSTVGQCCGRTALHNEARAILSARQEGKS